MGLGLMTIKDKSRLKEILREFVELMMNKYYITDYPQITKSDNITRGYNDKQSIHFSFKTTKPKQVELDMIIQVFVESMVEDMR